MGCISFFDEEVSADNEPRVRVTPHQVEVMDNHGVPQLTIGPVGAAHEGSYATFTDWAQFERFCEAVDSLRRRLQGTHR